jgi:hypothetical protein
MEHNSLLYERASDIAGRVAQGMKEASREAAILLYAPRWTDPHVLCAIRKKRIEVNRKD